MSAQPEYDAINPSHYQGENGLEAITVVEGYGLTFNLASAFKYILRAGKKPGVSPVQDLQKALWFVERAINDPGNWRTIRVTEIDDCNYVPDRIPGAIIVAQAFRLSHVMTAGTVSVLGMIAVHGDVSNAALKHLASCIKKEIENIKTGRAK